ncbi:phage head closure protein [Streptomyces sp. NPDC054919]
MLNVSAEVWRTTKVSDGMGGWVNTTVKVATVRARFSQPSAAERTTADQATVRLTHVVFLASGANVLRGDELRAGVRKLTVLAVFEPSEPGTYLRADCQQTQPAV